MIDTRCLIPRRLLPLRRDPNCVKLVTGSLLNIRSETNQARTPFLIFLVNSHELNRCGAPLLLKKENFVTTICHTSATWQSPMCCWCGTCQYRVAVVTWGYDGHATCHRGPIKWWHVAVTSLIFEKTFLKFFFCRGQTGMWPYLQRLNIYLCLDFI